MSIESRIPRAFVSCELETRKTVLPALAPPVRQRHIAILAVEALATVYAGVRMWREKRAALRTLRALDDRQLRDVGLVRKGDEYRKLAE